MSVTYPAHQTGFLIEEAAYRAFTNTRVRYLPIHWTSWHVNNGYGEKVAELKDYVLSIPKGKYFTVCQYDGGTLVHEELRSIGCVVFNCNAGVGVPAPLLCDPHPVATMPKRYLCCFVGSKDTHIVRSDMLREFAGHNILHGRAHGKMGTQMFRKAMYESDFCLCPRGYEATSFRMYEAIQMGCIPVYISDKFYLPFQHVIDWNRLAIFCKDTELKDLPQRLEAISKAEKQNMVSYGKEMYMKYLNMGATLTEMNRMVDSSWEKLLST